VHENFLLDSDIAVDLYQRFARGLPIIDYHCHLPAAQIRSNHEFGSLTQIWLDGDHYKWRAMRANGIDERFCTGDASDWEKFEAWARTVPATLRNPLYHWTHMELREPFGVERLLDGGSARAIYDACNEKLKQEEFKTQGLLKSFKVAVVCTTDDPTDSLEHHVALQQVDAPATRVYPAWRPDEALGVENPKSFNAWVDRLEAAANTSIGSASSFMDALEQRHEFFHRHGCRLSDHGVERVEAVDCSDRELSELFDKVRRGVALEGHEARRYRGGMLHRFAVMDHARGWVQQFHIGALRDNNSRMLARLGPNTGFDAIGDGEIARPLVRFLDRLDQSDQLTRTILYNLNPRDNELIAALIGSFQDGSTPGKMQYGPAWWFLDQRDGMEAQLRALSNLGLLSRFVGMATDSRSFLSYSRHDYFRRLLCTMLGDDVRRGLVPDDREFLGEFIRALSFENARDYFGFDLGTAAESATAQTASATR
jgi:glucuronate isomerase